MKLEVGKYYLDKDDFAKLKYAGKYNGAESFELCYEGKQGSHLRLIMPHALGDIEEWQEEKASTLLDISCELVDQINELISEEEDPEELDSEMVRAIRAGLLKAHNLGRAYKNEA